MHTARTGAAMSWETYSSTESDSFRPHLDESGSLETIPRQIRGLSIRAAADGAVRLQLTHDYLGMPRRREEGPVLLRAGGTAQFRTNGRFTDSSGGQRYAERTINAALGSNLDPLVFVSFGPTTVVDAREEL